MNVVVQPVMGYLENIATARSYEVWKPQRGKVDICLRNHSAKQITLPKQTAVWKIAAANIIPALLAPKPTGHEADKAESTTEKKKNESQKELYKIDLTGFGECSQNEQEKAWKLITEYINIFAMSNMDLGKTSLV